MTRHYCQDILSKIDHIISLPLNTERDYHTALEHLQELEIMFEDSELDTANVVTILFQVRQSLLDARRG